MNENPAVETISMCYTAFAEGRMDYICDELLSDDVVFHVPGRGSLAGDYYGKDEVMNYMAKVAEAGTVQMVPSFYLAGEGHIAVVLDIEGEYDGRRLAERGMQLFRLSDSKICERWSYPPESYACDEYFA